jgi:hypothetical protein
MELTILERVKLLELLPPQGDLLTLKILRKLRESLSFSEAELKTFSRVLEYACSHQEIDSTGKVDKCPNQGFFEAPPNCSRHDIPMIPTGQFRMFIPNEIVGIEKEIHMGAQALKIASDALERLNKAKQLTEAHVSLYEKFFPPEDKEE